MLNNRLAHRAVLVEALLPMAEDGAGGCTVDSWNFRSWGVLKGIGSGLRLRFRLRLRL